MLIPFLIIFGISLTIIIHITTIRKTYRTLRIYKIKWISLIVSLVYKFTLGLVIQKIDAIDKFLYFLDQFLTFYSFIALYFIMEFKYFLFITPTGVYCLIATFCIFTGISALVLFHLNPKLIPKMSIKLLYYSQLGLVAFTLILFHNLNYGFVIRGIYLMLTFLISEAIITYFFIVTHFFFKKKLRLYYTDEAINCYF